jgi:ubiquinone/menaquinone biosynthesis C-methylase UbiE
MWFHICYWDFVEKTESDVLVQHYRPENLDVVLDAGCGNGRSFETLPNDPIKAGMGASLNLLICTKKRGRADLLVCGELEHLPFKNSVFGTVLNFRVRQQIVEQEKAVLEIPRVTRDKGDAIFELYNTFNLKTICKNIPKDLCLRRVFNASFWLLLKSIPPFADKIPMPVLQL